MSDMYRQEMMRKVKSGGGRNAGKTQEKITMLACRNIELSHEVARLRRALDNIKIRAYELGQRELHDMALAPLQEAEQ